MITYILQIFYGIHSEKICNITVVLDLHYMCVIQSRLASSKTLWLKYNIMRGNISVMFQII